MKTQVNIESYYRILGLKRDASKEEIKKAYRSRAKELHPDVNKSANSHEQFILLNEAYEYLLNPPVKRVLRRTYTSSSTKRQKAREEARRKASHYAKVRYEEFVNSDYYKRSRAFDDILNQLSILCSILLL